MDVKFALLKENPDTGAVIDRLAKSVDALRTASKVSPALSATNNAALMVAYTTHKRLKDTTSPVGMTTGSSKWVTCVNAAI